MSARFFLDTNILAYTFDPSAATKQAKALELVRQALSEGRGVISFQVVQEWLNVALRKFEQPLTTAETHRYLDEVLQPLCEVYPSRELYHSALDLQQRWRYSFYDSLIVAAALHAECEILYSEDLQHDQKIAGLRIFNPFRD